jgi:hypothetical protein
MARWAKSAYVAVERAYAPIRCRPRESRRPIFARNQSAPSSFNLVISKRRAGKRMADQQIYAEWLKANPAPNFAALIARHGSYEAIPPQVWTAFADAQLERERRRRMRAAEDGPFA